MYVYTCTLNYHYTVVAIHAQSDAILNVEILLVD